MEMTFYDDLQFRIGKHDGKPMKRPVTLDLGSPDIANKKQRFTLLTSPDLNMLKLASPELERLIIANGNITTTPTPTQYLFPKNVTEEQEQYARGFIDALNQLHQTSIEMNGDFLTRITAGTPTISVVSTDMVSTNPTISNASLGKQFPGVMPLYLQPVTTTSVIKSSGKVKNPVLNNAASVIRPPSVDSMNSNSCNSNSLPLSLEIAVKEELQMVPSDFSTPPMSPIGKGPIDMVDQERIKLERKRHRNRIAASKCRKRKLEKISQLEEKVQELKSENSKLEAVADRLREQVYGLKKQVLEHADKGCQIMIAHGL